MSRQVASNHDLELFEIASLMNKSGLPSDFISLAVRTSMDFEGVYDLMILWRDEDNKKERSEIVADIQDMIDDCAQRERRSAVYIKFNDLEKIAKDILTFKDNLRLVVDKKGGIKKLSTLTGIPQPSLSRFFGSSSMPRRNTLFKIATALNLSGVQIATEWTRD
ncbi:MAG: helix-turn-helix transcriptional regulator [Deltaproteobacteria bacterium]|nr:helix-turn-helix transcriptional regulator [Deltaproteobacteria bacterium]